MLGLMVRLPAERDSKMCPDSVLPVRRLDAERKRRRLQVAVTVRLPTRNEVHRIRSWTSLGDGSWTVHCLSPVSNGLTKSRDDPDKRSSARALPIGCFIVLFDLIRRFPMGNLTGASRCGFTIVLCYAKVSVFRSSLFVGVDVCGAYRAGTTATLQQLARKRSEKTSMTLGVCKRLAIQSLSVALQPQTLKRSRKALVSRLSLLPQLPGSDELQHGCFLFAD
jgi:hypothetical protein